MPRRVPRPTREWLALEYVGKQRSTVDIAREWGVHETTVGRWLVAAGLPVRPQSWHTTSWNIVKNMDKPPPEEVPDEPFDPWMLDRREYRVMTRWLRDNAAIFWESRSE